MDEIIITMKHVRKAKMCGYGTKRFFTRHGLDFKEFCKNGIPASTIEKTKDAMAFKVIEVAKNGG